MPSEKVKRPGNRIIPFICRHDAARDNEGASLTRPAPDLAPDLQVDMAAGSCLPQPGVSTLGGLALEPSPALGYMGVSVAITRPSAYLLGVLCAYSSCPQGHHPGLSFWGSA